MKDNQQKIIIQLIKYKKVGDLHWITKEIPALTKDDAIDELKDSLHEKGMELLEEEVERGYVYELQDSYFLENERAKEDLKDAKDEADRI